MELVTLQLGDFDFCLFLCGLDSSSRRMMEKLSNEGVRNTTEKLEH